MSAHAYDIALWDIAPRCNMILQWILFILMTTWLSWLIFTALEVHSVMGGCTATWVFVIYSTNSQRRAEVANLLWHAVIFLSFGQHQTQFPDVFKIPTKKTSFRRFKSVSRVWPEKQLSWILWSVLPFCSLWSQPQLDEGGLYVWFALMYTTPDSCRRGMGCKTIGNESGILEF